MTTDLALLQNTLPADARAMLAANIAKDIDRLGAIGGKDVITVTQDKQFTLPDGTLLPELNAVIVDFVYRNEYYLGAFNRKAIQPPACFAISDAAASLTPSPNSPMQQCATSCATCQQNQFGSSPTGDGKACKNTVYLALVQPDAGPDAPILLLKTSPTAVKPFNGFVSKVARVAGLPINAIVTKLGFDPASKYASIRCEVVGANEDYTQTVTRVEEARKRLLQEPDISSFELPKGTTKS